VMTAGIAAVNDRRNFQYTNALEISERLILGSVFLDEEANRWLTSEC